MGVWISDFGFWILDLGFWISIRFFCGSPKRGRLDFGFCAKVWILHKIMATTRRLGSADCGGCSKALFSSYFSTLGALACLLKFAHGTGTKPNKSCQFHEMRWLRPRE